MTAGRRRLLLSGGFLTLAVLLTNSPARAQDGAHTLWGQRNLTPDQIREALARMGAGESGDLDPFQEMVKDYLLKNNPNMNPKLAADVIKKLTSDKQLMEQLKQFAKQKQTDPGRPGKLNQEDLKKLFDPRQGGKLPDLPPDLDLKGFGKTKDDPSPFNFTDPKIGPRPPVDPKVDPNPKVDPEPRIDPQLPDPFRLGGGKKATDTNKFSLDKNPFPEPEDANDPRTKSLQAFAALWERNVGPLSETPEVQRALFEAIGDNGLDFDMKDDKGNSLWDLLKNGDGSNSALSDLFNGMGTGGGTGSGGGNWNFGNWELPKFGDWFGGSRPPSNSPNWLGSSSSTPRPSSPSSNWGFGGGGVNGISGRLMLLLMLLVAVAVVAWYVVKSRSARYNALAFAAARLGDWPVDPRSINTREEVVLAFEYLSVLICGPSARNWTHSTIAAALADLATTNERTALMLARLYELARYAPLDEPLTHNELVETRKLVCSLAGVSY